MTKKVIENIRAVAFGASGGVVGAMTWDTVAAWLKSVVYDMVCR
jgi:hypothetical protein